MTSKIVVLDYNRDLEMLIIDSEHHYKTAGYAREAFDNWFDNVDSEWGFNVDQPDDCTWVVNSHNELDQVIKFVDVEEYDENEDWTDAHLR